MDPSSAAYIKKTKQIKNAANIEFNANRLHASGNNGKFIKKDITTFALKYHPNRQTFKDINAALKNNNSFQNRIRLIIEGKNNVYGKSLVGYKPHHNNNNNAHAYAHAREYAHAYGQAHAHPSAQAQAPPRRRHPQAHQFRETEFMNTPFGSSDNWQCCMCGAIIHANFYTKDECPSCGAMRGEGCDNNNNNNNNSRLQYNKPGKQSSTGLNSRTGRRRTVTTNRLVNSARTDINEEHLVQQNVRANRQTNNEHQQEMDNAYEAFKRGNVGRGGGKKTLLKCKNDPTRTYKGTEPSPTGINIIIMHIIGSHILNLLPLMFLKASIQESLIKY